MLFVEVPPYRDRTICHPAKVNFYVINGKKKRSQPQHFIYTPVIGMHLLTQVFHYMRKRGPSNVEKVAKRLATPTLGLAGKIRAGVVRKYSTQTSC